MRNQLSTIQAARALAALMVVAFHVAIYTLPDVVGVKEPVWQAAFMGYSGVEIFFVLSGFIMALVHTPHFGKPERLWAFLRNRFIRIYPFFWVILAVTIVGRVAVGGGLDALPSTEAIVKSILLLPNAVDPIIVVAWSLTFELMFYAVFSLLILNWWFGLAVSAIWFGLCLLTSLGAIGPFENAVVLSSYNMLFLFGMASAYLFKSLEPRIATTALVIGVCTFLAVGLSEAYGLAALDKNHRTLLFGMSAAVAITGLVALEFHQRLSAPQFFVFLGDASYSIYLVHILSMTIAAKILLKLGVAQALPPLALFVVLFVAAVVAGALSYLLIEKPLLSALRKKARAVAVPSVSTVKSS